MVDRLVIVTRQTELEALADAYGSVETVAFLLGDPAEFAAIEKRHAHYRRAMVDVQRMLPTGLEATLVERRELPGFQFEAGDAVVTLGSDGLLINTAQYLDEQPLLGLHADAEKGQADLCPMAWPAFADVLPNLLRSRVILRRVTVAEAWLSTGVRKRAIGDLFIGRSNQCSARYRLRWQDRRESHVSSGLIVATGIGSTGWIRSALAGARGLTAQIDRRVRPEDRKAFGWSAKQLAFAVREPYLGGQHAADTIYGQMGPDDTLEVDSLMPDSGVIFADGMYDDAVAFETGTTVQVELLPDQMNLVVGG